MVVFSKFEGSLPRNKIIAVAILGAFLYYFQKRRNKSRQIRRRSSLRVQSLGSLAGFDKGKKKKSKVKLDDLFWSRFKEILNVCIPSYRCREFYLIALQTILLCLRTFISIQVGALEGYVVKGIIDADWLRFKKGIFFWMLVSIPASTVNCMIKFLTFRLATHFRTNLTMHAMDLYLKNGVYYGVVNLDSRIQNADQMLTTDVKNLSNILSDLYCNIAKPVLDMVIFGWKLQGMNGAGLWIGFGSYVMMGQLLRLVTPNFGKMVAEQAELEGVYRFCHSRLIQNCEEIAFYHGDDMEKKILKKTYADVAEHQVHIQKLKIPHDLLDGVLMKYFSSVMGWGVSCVPVFFPWILGERSLKIDRTAHYVSSRRYLVDMGDAVTRLFGSYKDIVELAGYVTRVALMNETFDDINRGEIEKNHAFANLERLSKFDAEGGKTEIQSGPIEFDKIPIVTPNGDVLVEDVSLEIKPGMHLLITGPNGCGKSSLFRILGGLWPVYDGTLRRPAPRDIFYIPQRPYLSLGTFRDQVIYPHSAEEYYATGGTDFDLEKILEHVDLNDVLRREGGWDIEKNWKDSLSGGEKQRIGLARLFYHKPRYAIMDECTSQVSIDWEGHMYNHAKDLGITLLTVSHRPSLVKYHQWNVHFDGEGHINFGPLEKDNWMSSEQECREIEQKLREMPKLQARLEELQKQKTNTED